MQSTQSTQSTRSRTPRRSNSHTRGEAAVAAATGTAASAAAAGDRPRIRNVDPATGSELGFVECHLPSEVAPMVAAARTAQQEWRKTSFAERSRVLRAMTDMFLARKDEICRLTSANTGKVLLEAMMGEILTVCEHYAWIAKNGRRWLKPESRDVGPLMTKQAWVEFEPLGVIGAIMPFNYPFHHVSTPIASALMTGNACIIKPSEYVLHSSVQFIKMIQEVLQQCGHSPNLAQLLVGGPEVGAAMCNSGIDKVIFVGSPKHGKKVMQQCAETLTPVVLELGGKDAFIVCEDANLDVAVNCAVRGVCVNLGQNCIAAERMYVHEAIFDKFFERVLAIMKNIRQGAPLEGVTYDVGSMTTGMQANVVQELVDDAIANGAKLHCGGQAYRSASGGIFFPPTVLTEVTHDMRIVQEESFGPVMLLMKFSSDEDVVAKASDSAYGLSLTIHSRNTNRALALAHRIPSGMVVLNDFGVPYMLQSLPFGGVNMSGFGRFNGPEGLRDLCNVRSFSKDRFFIPKPPAAISIPYPENGLALCTATVDMMYVRGFWAKLLALMHLIRLIFAAMFSK